VDLFPFFPFQKTDQNDLIAYDPQLLITAIIN